MDATIWTVLFTVALCSTATAAIVDYRTGEIPNPLTWGTLGLGSTAHLALFGFFGGSSPGLAYHTGNVVGGIVLCAFVPFILWRAGGLGGGDLKLFTALGGLLGLQRGMEVQLLAFLIGVLAAPALLAFRGTLGRTLSNSGRLVRNLFRRESERLPVELTEMTELRFGPAIFAGTLASACLNWWR